MYKYISEYICICIYIRICTSIFYIYIYIYVRSLRSGGGEASRSPSTPTLRTLATGALQGYLAHKKTKNLVSPFLSGSKLAGFSRQERMLK